MIQGYQFWVQADDNGNFVIKNIHEGEYSLFSWVSGVIGEYKHDANIRVQAGTLIFFLQPAHFHVKFRTGYIYPVHANVGDQISLDKIVYEAPRNGPTLWEIGIPDRTAAEFFVPDPRPEYINPVFINSTKNR